jgi:microcompartment protein CcmK/EutM
MILAKVVSRVVSSAKLERLPARQLLSVRPLPGFGDERVTMIVLDAAQAGPGDTVLVLQEGTGVRQVVNAGGGEPLPSQMAAVGIVDEIHYSSDHVPA